MPTPGTGFPRSTSTASRLEFEGRLQVLAGSLPTDIEGHALTIGAIPMSAAGPQLAGDGIIYRISFDPTAADIKTRLVRTDCFLLDEATAGDPELGFQDLAFLRSSPAFGVRNFANTAFQPIQDGRLIVTYDAGRPWEIDPVSLDVITPVGLLDSWQSGFPVLSPALGFLPLAMTSAHPAYDAVEKRTYFANFGTQIPGLSGEPFTKVLWWDGDSEPSCCEVIDENGAPATIRMSCHQMLVTDRYLVLFDTAFQMEAENFFNDTPVTKAALPETAMLIIKKADLVDGGQVVARRAVVPIEGAHAIGLRDDSDGLRVMIAHQNASDPSEWITPDDVIYGQKTQVDPAYVGLLVQPADRSVVGRYRIDPETGEVLESVLFSDPESWALMLYTQDERFEDDRFGSLYWGTFGFDESLLTQRFMDAYGQHPDRQVAITDFPGEKQPSQLIRLDVDEMTVKDRFVMPLGYLGLSPTFLPRAGGARDEGYVLSFVVSDDCDQIWLFDSQNLAAGPLCRMAHPDLDFAFTLHTEWVPELVAQPTPTYVIDKSEDYGTRIEALSSRAQDKAREVLGI